MNRNKIILLVLAVFAFTACKKDPEVIVPEDKTTLELLANNSSKTWKVKEGIAKSNGIEVNLIASQNPCVTDNRFKLFSDFSYEFTEGPTKCDPNDPDLILKATWELSADGKTLGIEKFIFLGRTIENPVFTLTNVEESTFSGTTSLELNGDTYELEVIFEEVI